LFLKLKSAKTKKNTKIDALYGLKRTNVGRTRNGWKLTVARAVMLVVGKILDFFFFFFFFFFLTEKHLSTKLAQ